MAMPYKSMLSALALSGLMTMSVTAQEQKQAVEDSTPVSGSEIEQAKELIQKQKMSRDEYAENIKQDLGGRGEIIGIQELPIDKVFYVQAENGNYLVTSDGRFVIQGSVQDVWHRKAIDSLDDARSTVRVPLDNLNFDLMSELPAWRVGNPDIPRQGLVFVDPTSKITRQFLKTVIANQDDYHFVVALLPLVGGEKAAHRARQLWCAKDKELALIDLANGSNESTGDLRADCSNEKIMFSTMMTEVLRIKRLPHFIREDGLVSEGLPKDLDAWLARQ